MKYDYENDLTEILECARYLLSDTSPSAWNEANRFLSSDVSAYPGKLNYDLTPYAREIVNCCSPNHPARIIAIMKGAQIGFSTTVIEAAIGWIISQSPGNILFLTGHSDLAEEAMSGKIDQMIDSCGLRPLIRPNVLRKKNSRTGDTNKSKEFPGGSLVAGSASNHKLLRQRSCKYGFVDDFDAAKTVSKESGSTTKMIEQRFAAYANKMKLYYISTPELKLTSNIEPVFEKGDQRRYFVPCPCCAVPIALFWEVESKLDPNKKAGIYWELDENNKLIDDSVGYICQECGEFFTDQHKYEMNLAGEWRPTAVPSEPGYYSYHLSSLYAPPGMYGWLHYVRQYLEACPPGGKVKEKLLQTFKNLCLGETYEPVGESPKANQLQMNIRNYDVRTIPEKKSIDDGNGRIVLVTLAADLNGVVDDARLDYEVVAWAESGASYSVVVGSIGTFVPRENSLKNKKDRERWSYDLKQPNSVWPEFNKVIDAVYETDNGKKMKVMITGVDTGHYNAYAYPFIDSSNFHVVGLKGDKEDKFIQYGVDVANFKHARERNNLYIVQVNQLKDKLSALMSLRWDESYEQPPEFMNYPQPSGGLYLFSNYFSHFEAEHRVVESKDGKTIASRWVKKTSTSQNHFWDVRIYNMVLKDIIVDNVGKAAKIKGFGWQDYAAAMTGKK